MSDKTILVSVIMPGKYLHTAIMGILEQSYENFELICIDDASTDGSGDVLIQYQKCDRRIHLVHHSENAGAAHARNEGIELARGKYLFFVDADDAFERDLLRCMVGTAERKAVDMVYINYDSFKDGDLYGTDIRGDYFYFGKCFSGYDKTESCPRELLRSIPLAPYSRLYARAFIHQNRLRFQELKSSNDVYFGIMATALSSQIAFLEEQVNLVHVRNHDGRYRISNTRDPYDNFRAYDCLRQEMERLRLSASDIEIVQERFLENTLWEIKGCNPEMGEEYYRFIGEEGLQRMEVLDAGKPVKLDFTYRKIAEFFSIEPWESKWFENISMLGYCIEKWKHKAVRLFEQIVEQGKACGIWGAGRDGGLLAGFCAENRCQCRGFIDNDERKWGKTLTDYKIFPPEELLKSVDTVIVINQTYFNDIYDQIKAMRSGIELVSLSMYLQYEHDLDSSTVIVRG